MCKAVIGRRNAGFTIIGGIYTGFKKGFAIGENEREYVTWWWTERNNGIDFYHGHYFIKDIDEPQRSAAKAYADLYERAAEELKFIAHYGVN